jgi:uncharacterized protein (TIGR02145 family)
MKTKSLLIAIACLFNAITVICQETDTLIDSRDGKVYKTIKIGDQIWMAQNLNYKTIAYCWCFNDDTTNCDKYGRLYRWEAAMKACPSGWHLPSEDEWDILIGFLGGRKVAGGKMKSTTGWEKDKGNATNSSGFSALPAGQGVNTGFGIGGNMGIGLIAVWWTSTKPELSFSPVCCYVNYFNGDKVTKGSEKTNLQFSVRCVKDK